MLNFEPRGTSFVATVHGLDLTKTLSDENRAEVLWGLGKYRVLCIPKQNISPPELTGFAAQFGDLHQSKVNFHSIEGSPAITVLSNIIENGRQIGEVDAGQIWHTDMSYTKTFGFLNVLLARKVPVRDGKPLGATFFADAQAAYDDLPEAVKLQLADATATHDLEKYWEYMRVVKNSKRAPLTDQQRAAFPPVSHPVFMTHPVSGNKHLYVNPSFTAKIDGMTDAESDAMLNFLYEHILQEKYRYVHEWAVGDLVIWDLTSTWHNGNADYRPDEPRLLERVQVLSNKITDPDFVAALLKPGKQLISELSH